MAAAAAVLTALLETQAQAAVPRRRRPAVVSSDVNAHLLRPADELACIPWAGEASKIDFGS